MNGSVQATKCLSDLRSVEREDISALRLRIRFSYLDWSISSTGDEKKPFQPIHTQSSQEKYCLILSYL